MMKEFKDAVEIILQSLPWWKPEKPDLILATLLGSFLTILGVWLTGLLNLKHLVCKQKHDLKKEIYLPLIESYDSALYQIQQISYIPLENAQNLIQTALSDLIRNASRLNLVASKGVLQDVTNAVSELTKMTRTLLLKKPSHSQLQLINETTNLFKSLTASRVSMIGSIRKEIDFPIDVQWLNAFSEKIVTKVSEDNLQFIKDIESIHTKENKEK